MKYYFELKMYTADKKVLTASYMGETTLKRMVKQIKFWEKIYSEKLVPHLQEED